MSRHNREGARLSGARVGRGEDKAGELERLFGLRLADRARDLPIEGGVLVGKGGGRGVEGRGGELPCRHSETHPRIRWRTLIITMVAGQLWAHAQEAA